MVERQPARGTFNAFVDGCGVEADGLVVSDVAPALAVAFEELRVEGPADDRIENEGVGVVGVVLRRYGDEVSLTGIEADSGV